MRTLAVLRAGGGRAEARSFVRELRQVGFAYLAGHGVPEGVTQRALGAARAFFESGDEAAKRRARLRGQATGFRGYQALGENVTQGVGDRHEGLDLMREDGVPETACFHGRNLWPDAVTREALEPYRNEMLRVGREVMETIALGVEEETEGRVRLPRELYNDPFWAMRAIHYPQAPTPTQGCGEHTDYGLLTLIAQEDVAGCLFIRREGELVQVDPVEGCFVLNVGDVLDAWTDGHFKATPHLVRSPTTASRVCLPFFFEPNLDAPVWQGRTYSDHLTSKLQTNFELSEDDGQQQQQQQ